MSLKQNKIKTKGRIESQHDTEALIQEQLECQLIHFNLRDRELKPRLGSSVKMLCVTSKSVCFSKHHYVCRMVW